MSLKRKISELTQKLSHLDYKITLMRINQITHGWASCFKRAVAKDTMQTLHTFVWWPLTASGLANLPAKWPSAAQEVSALVQRRGAGSA